MCTSVLRKIKRKRKVEEIADLGIEELGDS
jgi:hypothetical protein